MGCRAAGHRRRHGGGGDRLRRVRHRAGRVGRGRVPCGGRGGREDRGLRERGHAPVPFEPVRLCERLAIGTFGAQGRLRPGKGVRARVQRLLPDNQPVHRAQMAVPPHRGGRLVDRRRRLLRARARRGDGRQPDDGRTRPEPSRQRDQHVRPQHRLREREPGRLSREPQLFRPSGHPGQQRGQGRGGRRRGVLRPFRRAGRQGRLRPRGGGLRAQCRNRQVQEGQRGQGRRVLHGRRGVQPRHHELLLSSRGGERQLQPLAEHGRGRQPHQHGRRVSLGLLGECRLQPVPGADDPRDGRPGRQRRPKRVHGLHRPPAAPELQRQALPERGRGRHRVRVRLRETAARKRPSWCSTPTSTNRRRNASTPSPRLCRRWTRAWATASSSRARP